MSETYIPNLNEKELGHLRKQDAVRMPYNEDHENVTLNIEEIPKFNYARLAEAKAEMGVVIKDKNNPFFKSKYADINAMLAVVEPALLQHKFILLQPINNDSVTSCVVDTETNATISSSIELPKVGKPQELGSAITYYRRYTLQSLLALSAEDDDGNIASQRAPKTMVARASPKKKHSTQMNSTGDDLPEYIPSGLAGQGGIFIEEDTTKVFKADLTIGDEIIDVGEWKGKKVSEVCDLPSFISRVEFYLKGAKSGPYKSESKVVKYNRWINFAKGR